MFQKQEDLRAWSLTNLKSGEILYWHINGVIVGLN